MRAPMTRFEPTLVAPDTFVIHAHEGEGTAPVSVGLNTLLIRGSQPVVVDTGAAENEAQYLEDLFALVEPEDIRWIFLSHDDVDHTGNLNALAALAPNATVVLSWFMTARMGESLQVHPARQRWVGDGESLDVGDRVLRTVRPPVFDSPTTRGLYDPATGVYWGSDSFATPMPVPVTEAADLDPEVWRHGRATFDNYISPWMAMVDDARWQASVDRVADLAPEVLVGCHTPVVRGAMVAEAIEQTRLAPVTAFDPEPDQAVLEQIQRALEGEAAAA